MKAALTSFTAPSDPVPTPRPERMSAEQAASVFAFDPDEEAVDRARAALPTELADRVAYEVGSATEVDIPRSAFDIVVFSWSL